MTTSYIFLKLGPFTTSDWIFQCCIKLLQWSGMKSILVFSGWSHNWKEANSRLMYTYCLQEKILKDKSLEVFQGEFFFSSQEFRFVLISNNYTAYYAESGCKIAEFYVWFLVTLFLLPGETIWFVGWGNHRPVKIHVEVIPEGHLLQFLS